MIGARNNEHVFGKEIGLELENSKQVDATEITGVTR